MQILILCIYMGVLLGIGFYYSNKMKNFDDFSLAGRSVGWPILLATSAATMIGGGASMGSVDRVIMYGAAGGIPAAAWYVNMIYSGHFVAPKLRKLGFITLGDFFAYRYGEFSRYLIGVISFLFCMAVIAAQIAAMGAILEATLGVPFFWAAIIGAAVVVVYSALGGMWAVIQTDVIQFLLLVIGFGIAAIVGLHKVGGYGELLAQLPEGFSRFTGTMGGAKLASLFVAFFFGEMFSPFYVQRMYAAKDERTAWVGITGSGVFMLLFMPITVITLGFLAQALVPGAGKDQALPLVIKALFPGAVSAVFVAAMMACVMSSCDSILSSCATIAVQDFYKRLSGRETSPRKTLTIARITTAVIGVVALGLALWARDIIGLLLISYMVWAPAAILPIIVGVSRKYSSKMSYAVVASMILGCIGAGIWRVMGDPYVEALDPPVIGLGVAVVVFVISLPLTLHLRLIRGFIPACTLARQEGDTE